MDQQLAKLEEDIKRGPGVADEVMRKMLVGPMLDEEKMIGTILGDAGCERGPDHEPVRVIAVHQGRPTLAEIILGHTRFWVGTGSLRN
jgi:hypothetical protein